MGTGTTLTFRLQEGWTLRKVATAMAREWLPPFRVEPVVKKARWVVQSVVEDLGKTAPPLWEPGIATAEYEERLDRTGLGWAIRATFGRGKGTVLARLTKSKYQTVTFQVESCPVSFPETLFDTGKVDQFLAAQGADGMVGFFSALLTSNGFQLVTV